MNNFEPTIKDQNPYELYIEQVKNYHQKKNIYR